MLMSNTFDLLLTGGTVLNPASGLRKELAVGITDGRIADIQSKLPRENAKKVLDVRGCYVTPGLIDFHVHSYWGVNPYGFNADSICLVSGVTTAIDAGSSGPVNFLGFKKLVNEPSKTRMLAFVAVAQHGVLNDPGELQNLRFADPEAAARSVNFDVGHGSGHFDFNLVRRAIGDGLSPDVISSDLHGRMKQPGFGIVGDLPTTLTKFLALGLNLDQIIAMCTIHPARVIGWQDRLGNLEVGRDADVTVLQVVNEATKLRDSVGGEMTAEQRIAARWTIRGGEVFPGSC